MTTPLFKTSYSFNSILTCKEAHKKPKEERKGPVSVVDICLEHGINTCTLVENNLSGYIACFENFRKSDIKMRFGLKIDVLSNDESFHKVILFLKGAKHYEKLCELGKVIFTKEKTPHITDEELAKYYNPEYFKMALPFYDSFLAKNCLELKQHVLDFERFEPTIIIEDNLHPFDSIIKKNIDKFDPEATFERISAKTICYETRSKFKSFCTYLCIRKRTTINKPNIDFLCSKEFCIESLLETNNTFKKKES